MEPQFPLRTVLLDEHKLGDGVRGRCRARISMTEAELVFGSAWETSYSLSKTIIDKVKHYTRLSASEKVEKENCVYE